MKKTTITNTKAVRLFIFPSPCPDKRKFGAEQAYLPAPDIHKLRPVLRVLVKYHFNIKATDFASFFFGFLHYAFLLLSLPFTGAWFGLDN